MGDTLHHLVPQIHGKYGFKVFIEENEKYIDSDIHVLFHQFFGDSKPKEQFQKIFILSYDLLVPVVRTLLTKIIFSDNIDFYIDKIVSLKIRNKSGIDLEYWSQTNESLTSFNESKKAVYQKLFEKKEIKEVFSFILNMNNEVLSERVKEKFDYILKLSDRGFYSNGRKTII